MPVLIIPAALRQHMSRPESEISIDAGTVGEAIDALVIAHPELREALFDPSGDLRQVVRIFVGETAIDPPEGLATPVAFHEEILLLPPIAGG